MLSCLHDPSARPAGSVLDKLYMNVNVQRFRTVRVHTHTKREIHNSTTYMYKFVHNLVLWHAWLLQLQNGLIFSLLFVCRAGRKDVHLMNLGASADCLNCRICTHSDASPSMLTSTQRSEAGSTECVASASGTCLVSLRILRRSHEPTALSSDSIDGEPKAREKSIKRLL